MRGSKISNERDNNKIGCNKQKQIKRIDNNPLKQNLNFPMSYFWIKIDIKFWQNKSKSKLKKNENLLPKKQQKVSNKIKG